MISIITTLSLGLDCLVKLMVVIWLVTIVVFGLALVGYAIQDQRSFSNDKKIVNEVFEKHKVKAKKLDSVIDEIVERYYTTLIGKIIINDDGSFSYKGIGETTLNASMNSLQDISYKIDEPSDLGVDNWRHNISEVLELLFVEGYMHEPEFDMLNEIYDGLDKVVILRKGELK